MKYNNNIYYNNNYKNNFYISSILLGDVITLSNNYFYELLNQENNIIIPCDFIIEIYNSYNIDNYYLMLISNFLFHTQYLAFGNKIFKDNFLNRKNIFNKLNINKGNKPNNSILINNINPYNLGFLITLYEYKIITKNIILNNYNF